MKKVIADILYYISFSAVAVIVVVALGMVSKAYLMGNIF